MTKKEHKDELEDVETVPREQAEKELHEAVKKVQKERHGHAPEPEDEPVTPETRKQAEHELHEAVEKARKEKPKK